MKIHVMVFWIMTLHPEDGGSIDFQNVGIPNHYTAS